MRPHIVFAIAALLAGIAVMLGAFGAHGLKAHLAEPQLATFQTATEYLMYHALALMAIAAFWQASCCDETVTFRVAVIAMITGILLFSGSLYLLLLTGQHWLVWFTPLGGLTLISAWIMTAWLGWKQAKQIADRKSSTQGDD